eukprot:Tbor_TRINITY_DN4279_c0_g1::TRINITY_DN4279_c0_g1_i1::g.23984::m.23984
MDKQASKLTFMSALSQFILSSVGMMLGNKMAVTALPLPCFLVIVQVFGTLGLLLLCKSKLQAINRATAMEWLPIAALFSFMMFSSMKSFVYVNVSTILIFRNISSIVTTFVEYFVRNVRTTVEIVSAEIVIVLGAFIYGYSSTTFNWYGLFWILTNVTCQVTYGVLLKKQMDSHPRIKEMNKFTMSFYNNMLALPFLIVMMIILGEVPMISESVMSLSGMDTIVIFVTCLLGFLISTSGFQLQQLVSATVFLVINNMAKFLNIALGMMLTNDRIVGVMNWTGCILAFMGGFWFSIATTRVIALPEPNVPSKDGKVCGNSEKVEV